MHHLRCVVTIYFTFCYINSLHAGHFFSYLLFIPADVFQKSFFFLVKRSFSNTIRVSNSLDPGQDGLNVIKYKQTIEVANSR